MRRVVVTGMGVVAPNGVGRRAFGKALRSGDSAIRPLSRFSHPFFSSFLAAEIPSKLFSLNGLDRFIEYGLRAVEESLQDSGLEVSALSPDEIGVVFSSSKGGMESLEKGISPTFMQNFPTSCLSSMILRRYPFRGPTLNIVTACATGTHTVIRGAQLIQDGHASVVLAGASDASLTPLLLSGYDQMGVLSRKGIFPFDRLRDGFVVGEGAASFILEEREHALRRGAFCYGEIIGYAMGQDPSHPLRFDPSAENLARVLKGALKRAKRSPQKIDYINAHGTATVPGDLYETDQIKRAFGKTAYQIPISSTKSMTGHLLGASGAIELAAILLAMKEGFLPPTAGLSQKDPACDLDYVPKVARDQKISTALSISMGFGGHISVIVVQK
ncbi:beta-ketoacyl-[acyl-carrier-protein] synthase family protein [candidate division TA06 bacterium]|nr:beta-ketoacyl-[acyl-carrier-protein] synthase family protein [candidate division TA06 bacterium]